MYRIVCDYRTNRLIYFCETTDIISIDNSHQYLIDYTEALPEKLTLLNVWDYRYNRTSKKIEYAGEKPKEPDEVLEENRKSLLVILEEVFKKKREPFEPSSLLGLKLRQRKLQEAELFINIGEAAMRGSLLESVAKARKMTIKETALLIKEKEASEYRMLLATETQRESLKCRILNAVDMKELSAVHDEIFILK